VSDQVPGVDLLQGEGGREGGREGLVCVRWWGGVFWGGGGREGGRRREGVALILAYTSSVVTFSVRLACAPDK